MCAKNKYQIETNYKDFFEEQYGGQSSRGSISTIVSIVARCIAALLLDSYRAIDVDIIFRLTLADHHPFSRLLLVLT